MSKTIFLDLDGCVFKHAAPLTNIIKTYPGEVLPGVKEKFDEWSYGDYQIVITTARPESMRDFTKRQLEHHNLYFDQLVMGLPRGERVVINDTKPAKDFHPELTTAIAIPLKRNEGLVNVHV